MTSSNPIDSDDHHEYSFDTHEEESIYGVSTHKFSHLESKIDDDEEGISPWSDVMKPKLNISPKKNQITPKSAFQRSNNNKSPRTINASEAKGSKTILHYHKRISSELRLTQPESLTSRDAIFENEVIKSCLSTSNLMTTRAQLETVDSVQNNAPETLVTNVGESTIEPRMSSKTPIVSYYGVHNIDNNDSNVENNSNSQSQVYVQNDLSKPQQDAKEESSQILSGHKKFMKLHGFINTDNDPIRPSPEFLFEIKSVSNRVRSQLQTPKTSNWDAGTGTSRTHISRLNQSIEKEPIDLLSGRKTDIHSMNEKFHNLATKAKYEKAFNMLNHKTYRNIDTNIEENDTGKEELKNKLKLLKKINNMKSIAPMISPRMQSRRGERGLNENIYSSLSPSNQYYYYDKSQSPRNYMYPLFGTTTSNITNPIKKIPNRGPHDNFLKLLLYKERRGLNISQKEISIKRPGTAIPKHPAGLYDNIKRKSEEFPEVYKNQGVQKRVGNERVIKAVIALPSKQRNLKPAQMTIDSNGISNSCINNETDFFIPKLVSPQPDSTTSMANKKIILSPQTRGVREEIKKPIFPYKSRRLKKPGVGLEAAVFQGLATKKIVPS